MALREVTVEVTAKYIVKLTASSSDEARKKAESLVLDGIAPYYMDYEILDVKPMEVDNENLLHKRTSTQ